MQLEKYDIIFYKGRKALSKLIKYNTNSEYSHAALVLDRFHICETSIRQPIAIKHFSYKLGKFDIYRMNTHISREQEEKMIFFIQKHLNSKYDYFEAFSYLAVKMFGRVLSNDTNRFICSSWINEIFKYADINLVDDIKNPIISPAELSKSEKLHVVRNSIV